MAQFKNIRVENAVLPNKLLSNFEHLEDVKKLRIPNFGGAFLRDTLPKTSTRTNVQL